MFNGNFAQTAGPNIEAATEPSRQDTTEKVPFFANRFSIEVWTGLRLISAWLIPRHSRIIVNKTDKEIEIYHEYTVSPIVIPLDRTRFFPTGWYGYTFIDCDTNRRYEIHNIIRYRELGALLGELMSS